MRHGMASRELHRTKGLRFVAGGYELVPTKYWEESIRAKQGVLSEGVICGTKAEPTSRGWARPTPPTSTRLSHTPCVPTMTLDPCSSSSARSYIPSFYPHREDLSASTGSSLSASTGSSLRASVAESNPISTAHMMMSTHRFELFPNLLPSTHGTFLFSLSPLL